MGTSRIDPKQLQLGERRSLGECRALIMQDSRFNRFNYLFARHSGKSRKCVAFAEREKVATRNLVITRIDPVITSIDQYYIYTELREEKEKRSHGYENRSQNYKKGLHEYEILMAQLRDLDLITMRKDLVITKIDLKITRYFFFKLTRKDCVIMRS